MTFMVDEASGCFPLFNKQLLKVPGFLAYLFSLDNLNKATIYIYIYTYIEIDLYFPKFRSFTKKRIYRRLIQLSL